MSVMLSDWLARLDRHTDVIPLDELIAELSELDISVDTVRDYIHFGQDTYQRNLMHSGPAYQALILCWRSSQRSPIHDHRGSTCGLRVLLGTATETLFKRSELGLVYPTGTRELCAGQVCGSYDSDIHQVSNLQAADQDLVTLHVYSPPLLVTGTYSLTDDRVGEFVPPVHEFAHGAGI